MCLRIKCFKQDKIKKFSLLPDYAFDINDYKFLIHKSLREVMTELNLDYPLCTFVIAKEGSTKIEEKKNVFTLWINDKHQVVNITKGKNL